MTHVLKPTSVLSRPCEYGIRQIWQGGCWLLASSPHCSYQKFVWLGLFMCTLIRYLGFMGKLKKKKFKLLSWMFQHDCLDTCCFECICMCFVLSYLHLFIATEHVSHGKALQKYAHHHYYYYYYYYGMGLRDGSAYTIVRSATLRQEMQIKLATPPSHSTLTPDQYQHLP